MGFTKSYLYHRPHIEYGTNDNHYQQSPRTAKKKGVPVSRWYRLTKRNLAIASLEMTRSASWCAAVTTQTSCIGQPFLLQYNPQRSLNELDISCSDPGGKIPCNVALTPSTSSGVFAHIRATALTYVHNMTVPCKGQCHGCKRNINGQ